MKILDFFWNNPYPESLFGFIIRKFNNVLTTVATKQISEKKDRIDCLIIAALAFAGLFFLTGLKNPTELLVDIPIYDCAEFPMNTDAEQHIFWFYIFLSAILIAAAVYLIQIFILHVREEKLLSINGFLFFIMTITVSAFIDEFVKWFVFYIPSRELFYEITQSIEGAIIVGFIFNIILYFIMQDMFTALFASILGVSFVDIFQSQFQEFVPDKVMLLIVVSFVLKIIIGILDKIGVWNGIMKFCAKMFYTPKYIVRLAFAVVYVLMWIISVMWFRRKES